MEVNNFFKKAKMGQKQIFFFFNMTEEKKKEGRKWKMLIKASVSVDMWVAWRGRLCSLFQTAEFMLKVFP